MTAQQTAQPAEQKRTGRPLLAPDEPPGGTPVNADGTARLLLICDHASNRIPRALDQLGLAPEVLEQHVAYDIGAARVAHRLSARFDAPLVLSGYSRLVIDCNRPLDDVTSIPEVSDEIVIPGNEGIAPEEAAARAEACFEPYHAAVQAQLGNMTVRDGAPPAIASIHSFTPVFGGFERPWHVGVLWNQDGRLALPFMDALAEESGMTVGDNEPYSARENFGYSIAEHGEKQDIPHILIEIRQDLIETEAGAGEWAAKIGRALEAALATLAL